MLFSRNVYKILTARSRMNTKNMKQLNVVFSIDQYQETDGLRYQIMIHYSSDKVYIK